MDPIRQWIQKEIFIFASELPQFLNFYNLRDKFPFYVTLTYLLLKDNNHKISDYISQIILVIIAEFGILSFAYLIGFYPKDILGFDWVYLAPTQYTIQIAILTFIAYKNTKHLLYSTTLGINGVLATGYLYELPFWLFSNKTSQAHLLHTSYRFTFYIDYQIISIAVFIILLKQHKAYFKPIDLLALITAYIPTFLMASQMYVWETKTINRIPMMIFSVYLTNAAFNRVEDIPSNYSTKEGKKCRS